MDAKVATWVALVSVGSLLAVAAATVTDGSSERNGLAEPPEEMPSPASGPWFVLHQVDPAHAGQEPTLAFDPTSQDEVVWVGGMNGSEKTSLVWRSSGDLEGQPMFTLDGPDIFGSKDTTVHIGPSGRVFVAKLETPPPSNPAEPPVKVRVRDPQGTWGETRSLPSDRPWFVSTDAGTFIAVSSGRAALPQNQVLVYRYNVATDDWDPVTGPDEMTDGHSVALADLKTDSNGRLHVLVAALGQHALDAPDPPDDGDLKVLSCTPTPGNCDETADWSSSGWLERSTADFGIPRLAIDGDDELVVVHGDFRTGIGVCNGKNVAGLWYSRPADPWDADAQVLLTPCLSSATHPALVASPGPGVGKFGVGWYEADEHQPPNQVEGTWDFMYQVFTETGSGLAAGQRERVQSNVYTGGIYHDSTNVDTTPGDHTSAALRPVAGGKVALVYALEREQPLSAPPGVCRLVGCDALGVAQVPGQLPPTPVLAIQAAGETLT